MRRLKQFALLLAFSVTLLVPFMSTQAHAMPNMDDSGMPMPINGCVSFCSGGMQLPLNQTTLEREKKDLEREPTPPPEAYWQMFAPISLALLYILPIFLTKRFYKDPKLILSTHLRF